VSTLLLQKSIVKRSADVPRDCPGQRSQFTGEEKRYFAVPVPQLMSFRKSGAVDRFSRLIANGRIARR